LQDVEVCLFHWVFLRSEEHGWGEMCRKLRDSNEAFFVEGYKATLALPHSFFLFLVVNFFLFCLIIASIFMFFFLLSLVSGLSNHCRVPLNLCSSHLPSVRT
jgi:hypothetical protein